MLLVGNLIPLGVNSSHLSFSSSEYGISVFLCMYRLTGLAALAERVSSKQQFDSNARRLKCILVNIEPFTPKDDTVKRAKPS